MKLKYYLRGMGVGVIVTTVILMIIFSFHKQETLSDDQIRERAAALGMVMADEVSDSGKLSDALPDDTPDTASDQTSSIAETQDDKEDNKEDNKKDDKKDDKKDTSDNKSETKDNDVETVEQIELSIAGGEYSDDVCKKLKRAGVIDDADDFNKYLSEGGYDSLIQPGTYIIPKDADYDTIIRLITEKTTIRQRILGKKIKRDNIL